MRIALYSKAINGYESFAQNQVPPSGFQWAGPLDIVDASVATTESAAAMMRTATAGQPRVWWRVESRWLETIMEREFGAPRADLVISNDAAVLEREANGAYMTLQGTFITQTDIPEKSELVSMVASAKSLPGVPGYALRRKVAMMMGGVMWPHGFGKAFLRPVRDKFQALAPYRFSIAIESESYPWWHTEKLFDCFATKTVPIYWGCDDFSKLAASGYDTRGIIPWQTLDDLKSVLETINHGMYETYRPIIEHNYRVTRENYCPEVPLARILREKLGI